MSNKFLKELYGQEAELHERLVAIQSTIEAFGGEPKHKTVSVTALQPDAGPKDKPFKFDDLKPDQKTTKRQYVPLEELRGYITEILKEENRPMKVPEIHQRLTELGLDYKEQSIYAYLSPMAKEKLVVRVDSGTYAHPEWKSPQSLNKKVITIKDVEQYFKLHKEARRSELVKFFVNGGLMTENMLQGRIEKLIKDEIIYRVEHGVYKLRRS